MLDITLTVINIILAILSGIGAFKSLKYFRKSHNLTIYAQTNKGMVEIQKMLIKLPEVLTASNKGITGRKGFSLQNALCNIGQELHNSLIKIISSIPSEYSDEFEQLQNDGNFNLQKYINSLISGKAVKEGEIDLAEYNLCQKRLVAMQQYLKKTANEIEEKLK